jgi:uncharacterized protein YigE (DUF2233 family)
MAVGRVPVGRLSALAALAAGAFVLFTTSGGPRFRELRPGLEFATLRGDPYCRRGSSDIAVLRIDPRRLRIGVHHYTKKSGRSPLGLVEWQRETGALAVFNAGQYYPDYSYMGLLVSDGKAVSPRLHPQYQAALVATPVGRRARADGARTQGERMARVLDLKVDKLDPEAPAWRDVAQSFMLFDRGGEIRTRKSTQVANRTAVAEDGNGRIVVIATEGAYTLYEFASLVMEWPLQLTHAMSMDGGLEAELCVSAGGFRYATFGHWPDDGSTPDAPGAQVPLPAVVTVSVR